MVALHRDDDTSPPAPLHQVEREQRGQRNRVRAQIASQSVAWPQPGNRIESASVKSPEKSATGNLPIKTDAPVRPRLRIIAPIDAPLPYVPKSMLVDAVDYRDEGCEFAASCLACPFDRCKYDDPAAFYKLDAARRDREIALLRREHHAPIDMLMQTYGLSRRQIFRVLREYNGGREKKRKASSGKRKVRSNE